MHNLSDDLFDQRAEAIQPWLALGGPRSDLATQQQEEIRQRLTRKAGARFGSDCFVAPDADVFTSKLILGDRSWIASGAIVRGDIHIGNDCSVNPYAHIAGRV